MCKLLIETADDGRMRLAQSVVMCDGVPVYIEAADNKVAVVIELGGNGAAKNVDLAALDLEPVRVGNVIIGDRYQYIQRAPVRKWKQGLNQGNIKYGDMPWGNEKVQLTGKGLKNAIINSYPAVDKAIDDVLNDRVEAAPISRHWGFGNINGVARLFYKDKAVGFLDDGEIIISKKYFFLKEDLLEVLNNVR